ncbi:hypothetical protein GLOIN_2v1874143 [Rhizophagus irregularis DAOM 181602=DAOM 197198]|nr:hypothetical protein GLOIN_2v1874143 [Rhizophagus irregularis DAOM 181602=DAOM 197198]
MSKTYDVAIPVKDNKIATNENETDKNSMFGKPHTDKPHNGFPITKMEISPNGKYLVTYSEENHLIVGWNVEDIDEGPLKPDIAMTVDEATKEPEVTVKQICVSDDKKLAYIYVYKCWNRLKIVDMSNKIQEIELYDKEKEREDGEEIYPNYCTFDLKNRFILYGNICKNDKIEKLGWFIWIYSTQTTQTKDKKWIWTCEVLHNISKKFELSGTLKDNFYLLSNNSIYECNITTHKILNIKRVTKVEAMRSIFINDKVKADDIKIKSNEKFICLKFEDKIIVYSIELEIPIATLDVHNDIQLYNFMDSGLCSLLPSFSSLFDYTTSNGIWDSVMKSCWKKCLSRLKKDKEDNQLPNNIQIKECLATQYAFGILDGHVWKFKFEEKVEENFDELLLSNENSNVPITENLDENDKIIHNECDDSKKIDKKTYEHLNLHLFNPYMGAIHELFQAVKYDKEIDADNKEIDTEDKKNTIKWKIKINDEEMKLQVFLKNDSGEWNLICTKKNQKKNLRVYEKEFKDTLPLPKHNSFKLNEWNSYVRDNKESFLKHGVELLTFAIKNHDLGLIDAIYEKCMEYFKEDVGNNKIFLSIITSTIPLLNEYYPEYIKRYSIDTNMIIDSPSYSIEHRKTLHLYSFSKPHAILPEIYTYIRSIYIIIIRSLEYLLATISAPKITFMVPYIKFVDYPQDYIWWKDFFLPQPSLFVKTTNRKEIYETWSGEALINYKWNAYGMIYYYMIWVGHIIFYSTFSLIAFPLSQSNIKENDIIAKLYTAAKRQIIPYIILIVLGFIYLSIEVRKFIYIIYNQGRNTNFEQWFSNIMGIIMYFLPVYTSFKWILTNERNNELLSFAFLFLTLKFFSILKFTLFYGNHYAIIINVGKKVFLFLVIFLTILIISFSNAFFILLIPKLSYSLDERTINDDPNNPWNIAPTYQAFNKNDINSNLFIIQKPDENTNMFAEIATARLATFLLLMGDTSVLSNWPYQNNLALAIMMTLFLSSTTIFILNVFIGLFSEAMNFDVETSMLMMKAKFLAEIEMFYLFPSQRRWKSLFPETIYYYADIREVREKIKQMFDNKEWDSDKFPEMKQNLLKILNIKNPQDN